MNLVRVNLLIGVPALVPARRLLRERREPGTALPDALGAVLLMAGVGALTLGVVRGPEWGWRSGEVFGSLATSAVLLALFVLRSNRHQAPVIELTLFRTRSFTVANAGGFVFALGFYALLLCNVLFLTSIWDYSIVEAGVALTPGPLMAALAAPLGGRLSDRLGQRLVALPGGLIFAAGALLFALDVETEGSYVADFLSAAILTGIGVGLSFAAFGSAAVAELPRTRFAAGGAISTTFRQIGGALGISALIAVLGTPSVNAVDDYRQAWTLMAITGLVAGLTAIALGRVRARHVTEPAPTARPLQATSDLD